jgi:hypothetical protein
MQIMQSCKTMTEWNGHAFRPQRCNCTFEKDESIHQILQNQSQHSAGTRQNQVLPETESLLSPCALYRWDRLNSSCCRPWMKHTWTKYFGSIRRLFVHSDTRGEEWKSSSLNESSHSQARLFFMRIIVLFSITVPIDVQVRSRNKVVNRARDAAKRLIDWRSASTWSRACSSSWWPSPRSDRMVQKSSK